MEQWMEENQLIFKLASIMLDYPNQEWINKREIYEVLFSLEDIEIKNAFLDFWSYISKTGWEVLTSNYVRWFDLCERTTLYMTYGIFGDNRERGPALVKLKMEYAKAGFYVKEKELPDFLPLILDFASFAERKYVQKVLAIHQKQISILHNELKKDLNPYFHLLDVCMLAMEELLPKKEPKINQDAG